MKQDIRALVAEFVGTAALLAVVVGSGIMAERLSGANLGVALLANALATGLALYVLITLLAPVSGGHFNPVVTLAALSKRALSPSSALLGAYIAAAYWFTASTSFANPAITGARSLTDTFSGVAWVDVPAFLLAQLCGLGVALLLERVLFQECEKA